MVRSEIIDSETQILRAISLSIGPLAISSFTIITDGLNFDVSLNLKDWVKEVPKSIITGVFYSAFLLLILGLFVFFILGNDFMKLGPFTLIAIHFLPHVFYIIKKIYL
jgi:hypothetical protein